MFHFHGTPIPFRVICCLTSRRVRHREWVYGTSNFPAGSSHCRPARARLGASPRVSWVLRCGTRRTVSLPRGRDRPARANPEPHVPAAGENSISAPSAGRPRSEEAHRAILDATLALLVEVGYSGLTVEGIAQRAGVGKATIYRRWASKLPLVIEAFGQLPGFEDADTGDLATDLDHMLRCYLRT